MTDPGSGDSLAGVPLRIALVTELYEPSVGGQQTRFRSLAHGLRDLGHDVTIIATMHESGLTADEVLDGIRVLRGPLLPNYMSPLLTQTVRSPLGMARYAWRCRRVLRANRFDAIYFNQWPYLHILLAGRYARQRAGIDWCEARDGAIHRLPERILPKIVRFDLAVNQWTADVLTRRSGNQVGYLPSGVDSARFTNSETERSGLLFLGRLVENKNLPLLISGFAEYRARGGQETLVVAGSGPEDRAMRAIIADLDPSVGAAIRVLGEVSDDTKRELLATKRLLVIPSRREGFPNAVVEALASGMPTVTVSSPENGTAHVVEQYGIGTVGEPTAVSLAVAIDKALANWTPLSLRCLDLSPQFDWSVLSNQLSTALTDAAQGSRR